MPGTAFLNAEQLAKDVAQINDAARGRFLSVTGMALAVARNYNPFKAPTHFKLSDMLKKFDKTFGATGRDYGKVGAHLVGGGPLDRPLGHPPTCPGRLHVRRQPPTVGEHVDDQRRRGSVLVLACRRQYVVAGDALGDLDELHRHHLHRAEVGGDGDRLDLPPLDVG